MVLGVVLFTRTNCVKLKTVGTKSVNYWNFLPRVFLVILWILEDHWWLFFKLSLRDHFWNSLKVQGQKLPISPNFIQGPILIFSESLRTSNDINELSLIIWLPQLRLLTFFQSRARFCRFCFVFVHFSHIRTCTYTNTKTCILLPFLVSIWCIWSDFGSKKDVWISTHHSL